MGKRRVIPAWEVLDELLRYDSVTGKLYWRERSAKWFNANPDAKCGPRDAVGVANTWNAKYAGKEAFSHKMKSGYCYGSVLGSNHMAHRIAYTLYHRTVIVGEIDHINGEKSDNRASNLREVGHYANLRNSALYSNNTSGYHGVTWCAYSKSWDARISYNGKQRRVGRFKKKEDAIAARKHAEMVHGYHKNHGRQAIGG